MEEESGMSTGADDGEAAEDETEAGEEGELNGASEDGE